MTAHYFLDERETPRKCHTLFFLFLWHVGGTKGVSLILGTGKEQCLSAAHPAAFLFLNGGQGASSFGQSSGEELEMPFFHELLLVLSVAAGLAGVLQAPGQKGVVSLPVLVTVVSSQFQPALRHMGVALLH